MRISRILILTTLTVVAAAASAVWLAVVDGEGPAAGLRLQSPGSR